MNNLNAKYESAKSFIPQLYTQSKDKVGSVVSSISMSEADYLYKTQNTDKDIIGLLTSKIEMEVIMGLKFIIAVIYYKF
jgi:hypothetical protein